MFNMSKIDLLNWHDGDIRKDRKMDKKRKKKQLQKQNARKKRKDRYDKKFN